MRGESGWPPSARGRRSARRGGDCCVSEGCFSYPVNPRCRTTIAIPAIGSGTSVLPPSGEQDKTFVVLTLSGGGTRAAAFATKRSRRSRAKLPNGGTLSTSRCHLIGIRVAVSPPLTSACLAAEVLRRVS